MQAAPARYVSASELYTRDEVELLLEEIRELEPTSCRGEDVQDFEIAGSGGAGAGGRSPAGTELTERSWDSHAHYSRAPPPRPRALAPVYCRLAYLATPPGALTLLLVLCSLCACACVWAALGLRGAAAAKPLLFGALTSLMLHSLLLLLHVSLLDALLPVDWNRLGGVSFAWSAAWLLGGAVALLVALPAPAHSAVATVLYTAAGGVSFAWSAAWLLGGAVALLVALPAPAHSAVATVLYTAAGTGLSGAGAALLGVGSALRGGCLRRGARSSRGSLRAAYRAVPAAPAASEPRLRDL